MRSKLTRIFIEASAWLLAILFFVVLIWVVNFLLSLVW